MKQAVVYIKGGNTTYRAPDDVEIMIVDYDAFGCGDYTLLPGPDQVTGLYSAWLSANEPEFYHEQLVREVRDILRRMNAQADAIDDLLEPATHCGNQLDHNLSVREAYTRGLRDARGER